MINVAISEHYFIKIASCLLLPFLFHTGRVNADTNTFEGEVLRYNIGFWLFKKVGTATFKCERDGDSLVVTIDACTAGFLDKIIHRHNIYRTTMTIDDITNRLKPVNSYEKKIKREKERAMVTDYDYENNICSYKTWRHGMVHKEGSHKLEPEGCDDMISVSYNFRNEIYGEVKDGADFNIATVYKDKSPNFSAHVRSAEGSDEQSKWKGIIPDIKYIVDIALDPELLDSKEGKLVVLLTEDLIPVGYVAKDVVGFGDLYGFLEEEIN
ncbi:beta-lactamase class C and other penicillin binding proteins [Candidatus Scalindua japonica]|uniref:Beta-lactamase class C and other penicillin binding proteins n=1 Tax=Candidatus Scalindua japonica TaxID=1284222 RepID=A0A286TWT0_9BACT|nr:DUF3108 domain-containing protein [Candidatus Scalindua japonica]GAX60315.1 beta-lactamase class C and other penicillin binding proteins [Candidatus Scalindua japonica]